MEQGRAWRLRCYPTKRSFDENIGAPVSLCSCLLGTGPSLVVHSECRVFPLSNRWPLFLSFIQSRHPSHRDLESGRGPRQPFLSLLIMTKSCSRVTLCSRVHRPPQLNGDCQDASQPSQVASEAENTNQPEAAVQLGIRVRRRHDI